MFAADQVLTGAFMQDSPDTLRQAIADQALVDEQAYLERLIPLARLDPDAEARVFERARRWTLALREKETGATGVAALMQEYRLDSQEGLALMSMAEALLRIPDPATADRFIQDRLTHGRWQAHLAHDRGLWVNTVTWGLARSRHWVEDEEGPFHRLLHSLGDPLLRQALRQAMGLLAERFVMGETILEALDRAQAVLGRGDSCSFDMLGEAALCQADATRYADAYRQAIEALGRNESYPQPCLRPSISIKLSALHPRFEATQGEPMLAALQTAMAPLIQAARRHRVGITLDAEEMGRLEPTLDLFARLYRGEARGWGGLGLAVQAYSPRALPVLCWLTRLAADQGDRIPVRLVKGAYWDTEVKGAQQKGLAAYPVFTRKAATDIAYLACARFLFSRHTRERLYPQLATHNARTLSQLLELADDRPFEFQRLEGMGETLYRLLRLESTVPCRIYAPVGSHRELLPYLVRRLLENGANSSFVNQAPDPSIPVELLAASPLAQLETTPPLALPRDLFLPQRLNSRGLDLALESQRRRLLEQVEATAERLYRSAPLIDGQPRLETPATPLHSPADQRQPIGEGYPATPALAEEALARVGDAWPAWYGQGVEARARVLERQADLLEEQAGELVALCAREAGKPLQEGLDEVREAADFCRYYAAQGRALQGTACDLPAITGETNRLRLEPRGVFLCISPWNFPLAIFTGQVAAALMAGNGVIAKPARQTSLIAYRACQLWLEAGVPPAVLALLPGPSDAFADTLLCDPRIDGVAFTGSVTSAAQINRRLAERRHCALPALIAETGGQNAMIVDSTALPEQVVADVLQSAFGAAGQRCSALRVLYLQEEIADSVEELLVGALAERVLGPPDRLATDVGPVIDRDARADLEAHIDDARRQGRLVAQLPLPPGTEQGLYVAPSLIRVDGIEALEREHFGPVLHLARYRAERLDAVVAAINASGYGLTLGIHSRDSHWAERLAARIRVGNVYINRNQVGAVVGCQPFGGRGLSGTGPKAGGPHYLLRFLCEKVVTTNTSAWGGDAPLLNRHRPEG